MKNGRMDVLVDWTLSLDVDDVLRGQGADPAVLRARRPKLVAAAERALQEGQELVEPVVVYRKLVVESLQHERLGLAGGYDLSGPLIAQHLAAAREIVVMVCSVGRTLEEYASEAMATSAVHGLALDGVGSAAAEALATEACRRFEEEAAQQGFEITIPLNPGMIGWPVAVGQPQIFALLDTSGAGITLSPSNLILPRKSLSMVLGIGPDVNRGDRVCDYCTMKDTCRYQDHYEQRKP